MNAEITRCGKWVRPSFDHQDAWDRRWPPEERTSQLIESLRNVTESGLREIRAAQVEILSVQRHQRAIQEQQLDVLKRIDRRLATKIKIRGHK